MRFRTRVFSNGAAVQCRRASLVEKRSLLAGTWGLALAAALSWSSVVRGQDEAASSTIGFAPKEEEALDAYINQALSKFQVPGAAVALIEQGQVVYLGVFGERGLRHPEPIDRKTRFMIGSITKPMTATVIGSLVDEGKLDWDGSVVDFFPSFDLLNAEDPSLVTLRHLLSHSTGTAPNDIASYFVRPDPLSLIQQVATLPPVGVVLGEGFDYHNHLFALAGYAAARAEGTRLSGRALLRGYGRPLGERLFEPTGMTR